MERVRAENRGLVVLRADVDVVDGPIGRDLTASLCPSRWVVVAVILDNVVLDERIYGPAVDR